MITFLESRVRINRQELNQPWTQQIWLPFIIQIIQLYLFSRILVLGKRDILPESTVEPGYEDIGLCDTSFIPSGILWY
jgi:hypothetical protein